MLLYYSQTVSAIATATCDLHVVALLRCAVALLLFEAITISGPLEGICRIQRFVGAPEQFRSEVYHGLDGLSKEKEHFFGC